MLAPLPVLVLGIADITLLGSDVCCQRLVVCPDATVNGRSRVIFAH